MSHVDDGELTAYADGAYPVNDPVALRIGEHLSTCGNCRTRLEQSEMLRSRASEILSYATPIKVETPAFEALQHQAITRKRSVRTMFPLAYAASIILALGLGWFGRGAWKSNPALETLATRDAVTESAAEEEARPAPMIAEAPADRTAIAPAVGQRGTVVGGGTTRDATPELTQPTVAMAPPPPSAPPGEGAKQQAVAGEAVETAVADLAAPQIAGLAVSRLEVRGGVTIVDQILPDGKLVRLTVTEAPAGLGVSEADMSAQKSVERREQRAATGNAAAAPAVSVPPTITVRRGTKIITINASLSPDSLRALAEKIK